MKILFTSHKFYPDIGGLESVSSILAVAFARAGHSLCLVTHSRRIKGSDSDDYPFTIIRNPTMRQLLSCYQWADVVFQNNIEIRQLWPNLFYRKPTIITLQTWIRTIYGRRDLGNQLKKLTLRFASLIISCSDAIRTDSSLKSIVIGNPYQDDLFHVDAHVHRKKSIVFLGRLVSDKGADLLLKAYASLNRTDWTLTIIGGGPQRSFLEQLASSLRIQDTVNFTGPLQGKELVRELNGHELMVVPSIWSEPFGIVVLEGMACGCVVLASDGGGLPDATGSAGLLFKRGDQEDLSIKLGQLIQNPDLRAELRSRSSIHLSRFNQAAICNYYIKEVEKVYKNAKALPHS